MDADDVTQVPSKGGGVTKFMGQQPLLRSRAKARDYIVNTV